jgi:hypothetical protein
VKNDIVLSDTCSVFRQQVQRVADMDPLLQDIEEEHLNETEQLEAEKEFEQEVSRPAVPENYYALMQMRMQMQMQAAATSVEQGEGVSSEGASAGISIPPRMPTEPIIPGLLRPPTALLSGGAGGNVPIASGAGVGGPALSGSGSSSQATGTNSTAMNSVMLDYVLKSFAEQQQQQLRQGGTGDGASTLGAAMAQFPSAGSGPGTPSSGQAVGDPLRDYIRSNLESANSTSVHFVPGVLPSVASTSALSGQSTGGDVSSKNT